MKEIWRRAANLFWEHPILWIPVLAADVLVFCITQLQRLATHRIVFSLVYQHPVLGNTPDVIAYRSSVVMKAALLTAPFVWGSYFISICLYTAAFLVTAGLAFRFLRGQSPNLQSVLAEVSKRPRPIFGFALKLFCMFVSAAMLLALVGELAIIQHWVEFLKAPSFVIGAAMAVSVCIAYCMVPSSLRLVSEIGPLTATPETIRKGRSIAIPVALALPVIAFCVQRIERSFVYAFHAQLTTRFVLEALASLVVALPYVPLFIALSLVDAQDDEAKGEDLCPCE